MRDLSGDPDDYSDRDLADALAELTAQQKELTNESVRVDHAFTTNRLKIESIRRVQRDRAGAGESTAVARPMRAGGAASAASRPNSPTGADGIGSSIDAHALLDEAITDVRSTAQLAAVTAQGNGGNVPPKMRDILEWERAKAHGIVAALVRLDLVAGKDAPHWTAAIDAAAHVNTAA